MSEYLRTLREAGRLGMEPHHFIVWRLRVKFEELRMLKQAGQILTFTIPQLLRHIVWGKGPTYSIEETPVYRDISLSEVFDKIDSCRSGGVDGNDRNNGGDEDIYAP